MDITWAKTVEVSRREGEPLFWRPYRALAAPLVFLLALLRAPPALITLAGLASAAAAVSVAALSPVQGWLAALLLQAWVLSDFIDGALARVRGRQSPRGAYLDLVLHHGIVQSGLLPALSLVVWWRMDVPLFLWIGLFDLWRPTLMMHHQKSLQASPGRKDGGTMGGSTQPPPIGGPVGRSAAVLRRAFEDLIIFPALVSLALLLDAAPLPEVPGLHPVLPSLVLVGSLVLATLAGATAWRGYRSLAGTSS